MKIIDGIPCWGDPIDEGALVQIKNCARTADYAALMADHHKGYAVPIGGVVAYYDRISPSGVGFDIGCGNKAVLTDAIASDVEQNISTIMDDIWNRISFGIGQKNNTKVDHELFDNDPAWGIKEVSKLKGMAQNQLGTVGSGNHYVDIFVDELNRIWIGVHFGSRGLGHKIATHFLKAAGGKDGMDVDLCVLDVESNIGSDYILGMSLAGRYAYAGRDWVCQEVARILGCNIIEEVHNHHNFAWKETHIIDREAGPEEIWVVRKGATPAFPGQKGFVGGTMGENSVILQGREIDMTDRWSYPLSESLYSTVHGAGRVMSRTAARGKIKKKKYWRCACGFNLERPVAENPSCIECGKPMYVFTAKEVVTEGKISLDMMYDSLYTAKVVLRGGGVDEAPQAYKRLPEVLEHHSDSIKILHTLKPLGVAMAGSDEYDPYKD